MPLMPSTKRERIPGGRTLAGRGPISVIFASIRVRKNFNPTLFPAAMPARSLSASI
jgi:hypothetical protein